MIDFHNQTDKAINLAILEMIAARLSPRDVELLLVDSEMIRELCVEHLGVDKVTDVLSFPLDGEASFLPLGSIVICLQKAEEEAKARGHKLEEEIALLFIHGFLHLLGFDHEKDQGEHRAKEEEWVRFFELPTSLIVRTLEVE